MIAAPDRIRLAPGVELRGGRLVDPLCDTDLPVNDSGRIVLACATVAEAASALRRAGARDGLTDALAFCNELNARALLDVAIPVRERLRRRLAAARYGIVLHAPVRRIEAPTVLAVARALAPPAGLLTAALLPLAAAAGTVALAAAVATGTGIVLHEAGHALALRGRRYALVLDGLRPALLHTRLSGAAAVAVAAAGPLAPALTALAAALAWRAAAPALVPLAAHALGLSILAADGRHACGLP